jgi:hypothetical protein
MCQGHAVAAASLFGSLPEGKTRAQTAPHASLVHKICLDEYTAVAMEKTSNGIPCNSTAVTRVGVNIFGLVLCSTLCIPCAKRYAYRHLNTRLTERDLAPHLATFKSNDIIKG